MEKVKHRNPLKLYLRDTDCIDKCPRAWSPEIYEFSEKQLDYECNAFDRFIPSMKLRSPDIHSDFTRYLQRIPTDHRNFYRWIMNSHDLSKIGTDDFDFKWEDIDTIQERISRIGIQKPKVVHMRRAYSESQINRRLIITRNTLMNKKFKDELKQTRIPFITDIQRNNSEKFIYYFNCQQIQKNNKCCMHVNVKSNAFVRLTLVDHALYGPERFYVTITLTKEEQKKQMRAGKYFTIKYENYFERTNVKERKIKLIEEDYIGPAIYIDRVSENIFYHPVYIVSNLIRQQLPLHVLKMETGEIIQVPRDLINKSLRYLPSKLYCYIRPQIIPCRLDNTKITYTQWNNFIKQAKETGEMYVVSNSYEECGELKIGLYNKNERRMDKFFCNDIHCLGLCFKDIE